MNYPSIKTIQSRLNLDCETAKQVRGILDGTLKPTPFVNIVQFHNPPKRYYVKLQAISAIIGGFGVEYIAHVEDQESFTECFGLSYVNMGDTYIPTVIYNHATGLYSIGDWGSIVEHNPNKYM